MSSDDGIFTFRYNASMQDAPRGGYYPANPGTQQPRQYQFSSTDPWQREERERVSVKFKFECETLK